MATHQQVFVAQSRGQSFEILEDDPDPALDDAGSVAGTSLDSHGSSVLGEIPVNSLQLTGPAAAFDVLAAELKKLHIQTPEKSSRRVVSQSDPACHAITQDSENRPPPEGIVLTEPPPRQRTRDRRSNRSSETIAFPLLESVDEEAVLNESGTATVSRQTSARHPSKSELAVAEPYHRDAAPNPTSSEQIAKHHAATCLEGDEEPMKEEPKVLVQDNMALPHLAADPSTPKWADKPAPIEHLETVLSPTPGSDQLSIAMSPLPHTSPASVARIEDSVEALDRLEDELEALDAAVQSVSISVGAPKRASLVERGSKPAAGGVRRSASTTVRAGKPGPATMRVKAARQRASTIPDKEPMTAEDDKPASKAASRRSMVTRPASLLPPKPPVRSTKAPTRPTFELPGEAVARRLKEQREARLSMQIVPDKVAQGMGTTTGATMGARPKSTKPPTVPKFELPGEAISRRKREEREAKLKAQEEEERRRREFKAKPIRTSIAPSTLPRETIASRARQAVKAASEEGSSSQQAVKETALKRLSIAVATSGGAGSSLGASQETRGRTSTVSSATAATMQHSLTAASRATSTSTGSISGKRSTLSAEDTVQQKLRGKEIYKRDNSFTEDRDRERRQREQSARLAREQAAERSRQASREWAEKQRLKQLEKLTHAAVEQAAEGAS